MRRRSSFISRSWFLIDVHIVVYTLEAMYQDQVSSTHYRSYLRHERLTCWLLAEKRLVTSFERPGKNEDVP